MAIQIPSLDDRSYEQFLDVLRRQIPPDDWTDHNTSDPGMTILEELCWLAEMTLYRMNRVPEIHERKFLNFLIDPPEPVTVEITFHATFGVGPTTPEITIPAGTLLANDFVNGRRYVFETFQALTLTQPSDGGTEAEGMVKARAILEVLDEHLGESNGNANQTFQLRPPRQALGISNENILVPVLTDFIHRGPIQLPITERYEPNPIVEIDGDPDEWKAVPSLLTERSRVTVLNPAKFFMVEPFENRIRFGDGVFGAIPPSGSAIVCTQYRVLDGPAALKVRQNDLRHILDFSLPPDVTLTFSNTDAEGGANFFSLNRRFEQGLEEFRDRYRLITEDDFEKAIVEDFNKFQELSDPSNPLPKIARASVVMNRRPPLSTNEIIPGQVTFILLPQFDEAKFRDEDENLTLAEKEEMVRLSPGLWERLKRFLDRRRLITTKLNQEAPGLKPIRITAEVVVAPNRNKIEMEQKLRKEVFDFLSLVQGDFDQRGWRLGRNVYRSQIFRLLEDFDGVDHVDSLSLSPVEEGREHIIIGPRELPMIEKPRISIIQK